MSKPIIEDNVGEWEHRVRCGDCGEILWGNTFSGAFVIEEPPHKCKASKVSFEEQ